jgi:hypothetical protein
MALVASSAVPAGVVGAVGPVFAAGWQSSNWAGYIVGNGPYTKISGQWTVPAVSASRTGFSAVWLGIDGVTNNHLIQVGTEQDSYAGQTVYSAWWEILPAAAVPIHSLHIHPGDRITATIAKSTGSTWKITISDAGHGSYTTTRTYGGHGTSAEWIVEAPVVDFRQAPLAEHGPVTFDHLTVNGKNPGLTSSESGVLVQFHRRVAVPTGPDAQRDGFTVNRL